MHWLKPTKTKAAGFALAAFALASGYAGHNLVGPGQFAMKETFGMVEPQLLPSSLYFHTPFLSYTHSYNSNTQIIEFNAGSCRFIPSCGNTADRNSLTATIALHYTVERDVEKLSMHRWAMDGWLLPDGYWLLTGLMNDSANMIFGPNKMAQTIQKPGQFLDDFSRDLAFRLEQNNVPVKIDSLELKGFNTLFPTRTPTYEARRSPAPAR